MMRHALCVCYCKILNRSPNNGHVYFFIHVFYYSKNITIVKPKALSSPLVCHKIKIILIFSVGGMMNTASFLPDSHVQFWEKSVRIRE